MNTKRKKTGRKLLGFMLTLALVLGLMPGLSLTAYATQNKVNYLEGSWDQEKGECAFTENSTDSYTVVDANSTAWGAGTYVVNSEVTISGRITVNGTANLILCDGAKLTASNGITVEDTNALYIYPGSTAESIEGSGQLIASTTGNGNNAGIGGTYKRTGGTVTIYGGEVTATSLGRGAGIGGGAEGGAGGTVTVYGGVVTATSKSSGAGIGGGEGGAGGTVTIYGGEVTATSEANGAGIGGGSYGAGGTVTVYGGEVTATSESWGAGIGGGWCESGGTVSIYGGTVTASGGNKPDWGNFSDSMGIGNGCYQSGDITAGTLTLGSGVKLYNGTDNNGDVLDGIDGTERSYNGSRPQNMFAETVVKLAQTVTPPTAATDLTYIKDQAQDLLTSGASVTTGNTTEGSVQYKVGADGTWSTEIPKGTNAGTYSVYYKVSEDDTYAEYAPTDPISVTIAKADPETPTGMTGKYGQTLSTVSLPGGWSWAEDDTIMNAGVGDYTYQANYNPTDDKNYNSLSDVNLTVNVGKGDGTISFGQTVVESTIGAEPPSVYFESTGDGVVTFTSENENVATVNNNGYLTIKSAGETTITASVEDSDTYQYATKSVSYKLIVKKRSVSIKTVPTASEITYGQTLANSTLSGGEVNGSIEGTFSWADSGIAPAVSDSEMTEYAVKFTPKNSDIYAESTVKVTIKVNKQTVTLEETQKPVAKTGADLYYTGSPIELITAPTSVPADYTIKYSTDNGSSWSAELPTGKDAGDYTVKVKYESQSGNYEDIQLEEDIPVTITVDKSILGNVILEATEYKEEITNKNTDNIYEDVISTLGEAISTAETANNNTEITDNDVVSAIDALTTALNKAKADVEKIENHKAFDEYKKSQKTAAGNKAQTGDSEAAGNLITTAQNTIETLVYDDNKSLDENKAAVDAIINKLEEDLTDQRAVDAVIKKIDAISDNMTGTNAEKQAIQDALDAYDKLTADQKDKISGENKTKLTGAEGKWVDAYKTAQKNAAGALVSDADSEAAKALVTNAQNDIDNITYDQSKGLDVFKAAVDAIITKVTADVADQKAADAVIKKIDAISDNMTGTNEEKEAIKDALAAYDTLTENQKDKISGENKTKLNGAEDKWVDAYKTAQKNAAGALVSDADSEAAKTLVTNAQNDIDNITYDQSKGLDVFKAAVDAIITKVTADVADQKAADAVITQINALRVANEVTIDDKNAIEDARAAYNALTDGQKSKVTDETLKKLTDAEAALKDLVDAAEAKKVADKIDKLPSSDKVALTDKGSIEAARAAYNALTEDQKDKVTPETLKKLTDVEDRLKILQVMSEVSAKTGSDMTYTGDPIQLINTPTTALPAGYTMKYAVTTENVKPTDEKLYTTDIPTKTEVGTYYVWYKVVGDENHNDVEPKSLVVTINEKQQTSNGTITTDGIYCASNHPSIQAGMVIHKSNEADTVEYRWVACDSSRPIEWFEVSPWTKDNNCIDWTPEKSGEYVIVCYARVVGNEKDSEIHYAFGTEYHKGIKGICQIPYTGEGGGYLIGIESYNNPNNSYQYEMLILDFTLLAQGKDAWIYTTGRCGSLSNCLWTVWQPKYGYYWTLFRIYDADGNMIDEQCFGFANVN